MPEVVSVELGAKRVERGDSLIGALAHPDGDRAVQRDNGRRPPMGEHVVERGDLTPVRRAHIWGFGVQRGDGCLYLQRTRPPLGKGLLDECESFGDRVAVPAAPVLLLERCLCPVRVDARVAPGVVQEHQRQQASRLGLVGQEVEQQTPEPDRLVAQLSAYESVALGRAIALVEHEVDDRQRGIETIGQQRGRRQGERDVRGFHLPLGPYEPLRHRRLGHEERPCD